VKVTAAIDLVSRANGWLSWFCSLGAGDATGSHLALVWRGTARGGSRCDAGPWRQPDAATSAPPGAADVASAGLYRSEGRKVSTFHFPLRPEEVHAEGGSVAASW